MPARGRRAQRYTRRLVCVPASTIAIAAPTIFHQPGRDRLQSLPPAHPALRVPESTRRSALSFRSPSAASDGGISPGRSLKGKLTRSLQYCEDGDLTE